MKRVLRRPSPAMVIAIVALIAALGGTAIAGGVINKKKAKNIANNVVTQRAPGLSVSHAGSADNATNATNATNANNATTANTAKNVFFAQVDYNDSTPAVLSGSPGVAGDGEDFLGAPALTFPRNMAGCAVTVNLFNGGLDGFARQSTNSSGSRVVVVLNDQAGADVRSDYNLVAVCP
jgi:hypothetical protein